MIGGLNAIVERYHQDAADYARYWAPVLEATGRRLLDYVDDFVARRGGEVRVVEVGVGTGSLVLAALERWPRVELIATDAARGMLELARERVAAARAGEARVRFVEGPADALPLADGSADLVISTFVLQLVPDRLAALREAGRLLQPGGMVSYLTWLDRDSSAPFPPADEFDEAVYDLDIEEPELADEPHAGDVRSGRTATAELRRAGFARASAREDELVYEWTMPGYLDYKVAYDERALLNSLSRSQHTELQRNARARLAGLPARDFRWHAPVVFARALKPR